MIKMSDILKRLEALERDIVAKDSSKRLDMDMLLAGLAGDNPEPNKPTQAEPSEPIDFEKMVQTLSDYRKVQSQKKEKKVEVEELIIE